MTGQHVFAPWLEARVPSTHGNRGWGLPVPIAPPFPRLAS
jgi:hypothetical protein